ncbi:MAG: SdrD B-like domain-containing protein, partial [Campylobacterota bacterium]|nr:SdrD B-like domain-containing protein [Campylobacterota bacterium]
DTDPSHYFGENASIDIEKTTNGQDADTLADAVILNLNDAVTWDYTVTNTGNVVLRNINAQDDKEGQVTCDKTTLAAGERMQCTEKPGNAIVGNYENIATVVGTPPTGTNVTDNDPSHYRVTSLPSIDIEKSTNGQDADFPEDAVVLNLGDLVTWSYTVTNTGNVVLTNINATDDKEGDINCSQTTLAVGESMQCTDKTGTAIVGNYGNMASVTGRTPTNTDVTDDDPSHYRVASEPSIDIEKTTNGQDADVPENTVVLNLGDSVTWSYTVTNRGNVVLTDITVLDSQEGQVTCNQTTLAVGESMQCTDKTGSAVVGDYRNLATVTGTSPTGTDVTDNDPSHYRVASEPSINIEKTTNGEDADTAPGPNVHFSETVYWEYTVTNTGNVNLININVNDNIEGAINCPSDTLSVGESMVCLANTDDKVEGQYENNGSVEAESLDGTIVSDWDLSHYIGEYTGASHIGDYAWYDDNNNGIQDDNEKPVEGLTVELFDENGVLMEDRLGNSSYKTDSDGLYLFHLFPGTYSVKFSGLPENYVFTQGVDSAVDRNGQTVSVTVVAGEYNLDLDAGIYCTCIDMESKGDSGSAMGNISAAFMILITLMLGLFFVRREEQLNQLNR